MTDTLLTHGAVTAVTATFRYDFGISALTGKALEAHNKAKPAPKAIQMQWDTYSDLTDPGRPDHDLLRRAFEVLNITDHPRPYSLSVGDEVTVWREAPDKHVTFRTWRCDPLGWTLIDSKGLT